MGRIIGIARPMRLNRTSMINRDINEAVKQLSAIDGYTFKVITLYDYPEGKAPQEALDEFVSTLDECLKNPTDKNLIKLNTMSLVLYRLRKMGIHARIGKGDQTLAEYWAKQ